MQVPKVGIPPSTKLSGVVLPEGPPLTGLMAIEKELEIL
jgi:hypothetical protein